MKIRCHCDATISDSTDSIPHKAHLTPDPDHYGEWERIDDEVIDGVASGGLAASTADMKARRIIHHPTRPIVQCIECGRLYIDGLDGKLNCFVPENEETGKRILRFRTLL